MGPATSALELLKAMPNGSDPKPPDRFWELVEHFRGELINQALALVGNLADAEDVVQETFCEAHRRAATLKDARSLSAWLRTVNRANALNKLRARKNSSKGSARLQREAPPRTLTTGGFSVLEMRDTLAKAIETLPPNLRQAVVLRFWEGLSFDEIAARLKVPAGTARWMLTEASTRLYDRLKPYLESSGPAKPKSEANDAAHTSDKEPTQ